MSKQKQDIKEENKNILTINNEVEPNPKLGLLIEPTATLLILLATLIMLICIGFLIQGYLNSYIAYQELIFDVFRLKFGIQEFNYLCFKTMGYSLLLIANFSSLIAKIKIIIPQLLLFFIAIFLVIYYFTMNFYLTKYSLNDSECLIRIVIAFTVFSVAITDILMDKKNKNADILMNIVSFSTLIIVAMSN